MISLAVDIGGSKAIVGLVDEKGTIIDSVRFLWKELTKSMVSEQLAENMHSMLDAHPSIHPDVIGITIPGLAEYRSGTWVEASFSGIRNWMIADEFSKRFDTPCYADNDANAACLAEKLYGKGKALTDFVYITVSNGIGGAAFCNGALLRGVLNSAMEIGHCTAVLNGRLCGCGNRGCLEMHAAGPGIAKNYQEICGNTGDTLVDCAEIAARARNGEKNAITTFELEGRLLGTTLAQCCNLLNPEAVFIGGGVSGAFDLFSKSLLDTLQSHIYRKANPHVRVEATGLGYQGALLGAAAVGFQGAAQSR